MDIWEGLAPFLGLAIPFIMARFVSAEASGRFKLIASLVLTVAITAVSLATEPGEAFTLEMVAQRAGIILAEAQALYAVVTVWVSIKTDAESMNQIEAFKPRSGLGG